MKTLHILSLGGGVQSTAFKAMDSMAHHLGRRAEVEEWLGEAYTVPPLDYAIFADTKREPRHVYENVERLREHFGGAPILVRSRGDLGRDLLHGYPSKTRAGDEILGHKSIPAFVLNADGSQGLLGRQCTKDYKTNPVQAAIRQDIVGLAKGHRFPANIKVYQYFGLSHDEPGRCTRVRNRALAMGWFEPVFPLYDMVLTRFDCEAFNREFVPWPVLFSSCVFCPLHDNAKWRWMRDNSPDEFMDACAFDEALRKPGMACNATLDGTLYLHRSMVPLREADIDTPESRGEQYTFGFGQECEGLCGN